MPCLMGIDLGTSSIKTIIMDERGGVKSASARFYQYDSPVSGYAEQDPEVWWMACVETIKEALAKSKVSPDEILGLSFSGQMHGAVLLDENNRAIRPVILHCDVRSGKQVNEIKELLGPEKVYELMGNPVYTGFLLVSLLWVRENEPHNYAKIRKVCLPKDYIKYKLTGEIISDYSDASATLAFDISRGQWSGEILQLVGIPIDIFPPCVDTYSSVGNISRAAAGITGLSEKTVVVSGGGDQVMQGIGNGMTDITKATVNIGSSGQVCFQSDSPVFNPNLSTNTFCGYKKSRWIVMGATMYAGLSLKWFNRLFGNSDYGMLDNMVEKVKPGSDGIIFLPYLNGERTPHTNPDLSAMFIGCSSTTGRVEMTRAVMEGVSYALFQCMEVCGELGLKADLLVASGGGARSALWLQMQSDVFGLPLRVADTEEQACLGAAIAAGVGAGVYADIEQGCAEVVRYKSEIIVPSEENHKIYMDYYSLFKDAYVANKELLMRIAKMRKTVVQNNKM